MCELINSHIINEFWYGSPFPKFQEMNIFYLSFKKVIAQESQDVLRISWHEIFLLNMDLRLSRLDLVQCIDVGIM